MTKDPKHVEDTAYDILNLTPDAAPEEIRQALPNFLRDRRNVQRLGKAQSAIQKLRDPHERARIDVWYYELQQVSNVVEHAAPLDLAGLAEPTCLPVSEFYTDLRNCDFGGLGLEIPIAQMQIVHIKKFGDPTLDWPLPAFDR